MLIRLYVVAVCFAFAGLSAGQTSVSSTANRKDRATVEGSGAGSSAPWPSLTDDEDAPVEGSGTGGRTSVDRYDEGPDSDNRGNSEGSGGGPAPESYPKPNKNDDSSWQTPWDPAKKSDELPGIKQDGKKNKNLAGGSVDSGAGAVDDGDDFSLPGGGNAGTNDAKPGAPAAGNDVSGGVADGKKSVGEDVHIVGHGTGVDRPASFFAQPGILAAVIGGVVVGLLCTVLLLMYIVYRMRKMDEGSYPLEEPRKTPSNKQSQEFFA